LVDAEFVNQRIFYKLSAIQDAALMRSSSQVPIQEAEFHNEDMSNGPISLSDNDDYGSISRRSSPYISTKSLPSHVQSNQYTPNDPALRVRSESFPMSDSLVDGVSGRLLTDKQHSSQHESGLDVAGPTVRHDLDHSAGSGPHAHTVPS
jgi:hypothetical protein